MPDLFHSLLKQDIGHLRIIAELWGIELDSPKVEGALEELSASLLDPNLLSELIDSLSPEVKRGVLRSATDAHVLRVIGEQPQNLGRMGGFVPKLVGEIVKRQSQIKVLLIIKQTLKDSFCILV